jgi:hypothetical protein
MKVSTENDNNFGYEKITILVDIILLSLKKYVSIPEISHFWVHSFFHQLISLGYSENPKHT